MWFDVGIFHLFTVKNRKVNVFRAWYSFHVKEKISLSSMFCKLGVIKKCLTTKTTKNHLPTAFTLTSCCGGDMTPNAINERLNQFRIVQKLDNTQWMFNSPCKRSLHKRVTVLGRFQKTSDEHLENQMKLQYQNKCGDVRWKIRNPVKSAS